MHTFHFIVCLIFHLLLFLWCTSLSSSTLISLPFLLSCTTSSENFIIHEAFFFLLLSSLSSTSLIPPNPMYYSSPLPLPLACLKIFLSYSFFTLPQTLIPPRVSEDAADPRASSIISTGTSNVSHSFPCIHPPHSHNPWFSPPPWWLTNVYWFLRTMTKGPDKVGRRLVIMQCFTLP